jgi:multiple sugar transport system permease protein
LIADFRQWRSTIPPEQRMIGQTSEPGMLPQNLRSFRRWMAEKYDNDLDAYNRAASQASTSWSNVRMPTEMIGRYLNRNLPEEFLAEIIRWRQTLPATECIIEGARGQYALGYLYGVYTSQIEAYNLAHGTTYGSYSEVPCPDRVPPEANRARDDWTRFVRNEIKLRLIKLDDSLETPFRKFIRSSYDSIAAFNKEHLTTFASIDEIPFPRRIDEAPYLRQDFEKFIKLEAECPIESIAIYGPDEMFREFLVEKHGHLPEFYPGLGAVAAATDWEDCMERKGAIRWEFTKRNYWQVIDYIAMHGNGLMNTLILCTLAVATALVVNPLAAYALSRFNLPGTYKILLFCMATMAFPGEVTMIPGFLLLKRFPLLPITVGLLVTIALFLLLEKTLFSWKEKWRALTSLAAGLLAGGVVFPAIAPELATMSLLNSFAALILPGMANGFSIFLLKGFFDSMPKELYEAADIDGASEWTKFWMLTMNLSKPILAVIALGAFTGAYSAFMMALVIIPDEKMWTIMVWIFQFQNQASQSVVYASLVIAAVPTFIIFAFCQNVIIRGIVVPTEK